MPKPKAKSARPQAKTAARTGAKAAAKQKAPKKAGAKPTTKGQMRMPPPDAGVAALMDDVCGAHGELRAGKMFGCPGYFVGRKAVACVFGNDLNLTLPPARIDELVTSPGFKRFQAFGRTMSGWILLDKKRVAALANDVTLLEDAIAYARSKMG